MLNRKEVKWFSRQGCWFHLFGWLGILFPFKKSKAQCSQIRFQGVSRYLCFLFRCTLNGAGRMCFSTETLGNIIYNLSVSHPSSPSSALVNLLLHISPRKVDESTFSFSFGVNISQWNYSFGLLNAMESQHLMGKSVKCKSINVITKSWLECVFCFQAEHNFALQIFVLRRVWGCVFDDWSLNSRLHIINHLKMDTGRLLCAISGGCANRCLRCLVTYGIVM